MNLPGPEVSTPQVNPIWKTALWVQLIATSVGWSFLCLWAGIPSTSLFELLFFGLLIWQCAMLGSWAGLGRSWRRWPIIALVSPLLGFVCSIAADGELLEFQIFCLGIIGIVTLTTWVLRVWKGQLVRSENSGPQNEALQFEIKHVLIWTTVIAALLAGARFATSNVMALQLTFSVSSILVMIVGLAACVSFATVVNVWGILGHRISGLKIIALLTVTVAAMIGNYLLGNRGERAVFAGMVLVSQTLVVVTLLLLRMQGFRFVKSSRMPSE